MDKALDMSLDDIIKSKKSAGRGKGRGGAPRGRGGRGGSFSGGRMRGVGRGSGRQSHLGVNTRPSSFAIAKSFRRSKNFPWQHDLLEESLAAVGIPAMESGTKLYISNLDAGVSNDDISGSAEVVYAKRSDAFAAHKRYNNVQLDGQRTRGGSSNGQGRAQNQNRGARRGRGRGRGRGKKQVDKSAEDLDKELENYHAEGMQIS